MTSWATLAVQATSSWSSMARHLVLVRLDGLVCWYHRRVVVRAKRENKAREQANDENDSGTVKRQAVDTFSLSQAFPFVLQNRLYLFAESICVILGHSVFVVPYCVSYGS